jgi:hypothetical protein
MLKPALFALAAALCLLAACGDDDEPTIGSGPAENVAGVWEGNYTTDAGTMTGLFCLYVVQDGRSLGGSVNFDGGSARTISGAVAEAKMVFNWNGLSSAGSESPAQGGISAAGTFSGDVSAGTFTGTYSVTASGERGTWSGNRSSKAACE